MKRIMSVVLAVMLVLMAGVALGLNQQIRFLWEQDAETLEAIKDGGGWKLYEADVSGGEYVPSLDVEGNQVTILYIPDPDNPNRVSFNTNQTLVVNGAVGSTVTKYYIMKAFKGTEESAPSNEALNTDGTVGIPIKIPLGVPFSFEATIVTNP